MSDPVKNVEIEDVLSSIRKLVADDTRVAPAMPKKEPGRLVLTPAQRVKEAPKPEKFVTVRAPDSEMKAEGPPAQKQDFPHDLSIEEVPRDARLADFGEVEGAFPDMDELPSSDMQDDAEFELGQDTVQSTARLELGRLIEQEVAAALKDVPVSDELSDAEGREPFDDMDWDVPDESFNDEFATVSAADAEMAELDDTPAEEKAALLDDEVSEMEALHVHVPPPLTLEDKVAALGRLVARDTNEFEEERDDPNADDLTAVAERMTWPEAVPVEDEPEAATEQVSNVLRSETAWQVPVDRSDWSEDVEPEPEPEAELEPEPEFEPELEAESEPEFEVEEQVETNIAVPQPFATPQPSVQFDEDMLRDLVGDIVRQELQGALGERITRNVRKLVRREIHRMLISQEME